MFNSICKFLLKLSGWKVNVYGTLSDKNVIAVFPHTSYWDGIIGFFAMRSLGINYKTLSASWLFFFPMKYVMKYLMHASPVKSGTLSSIRESIKLFENNDKMSLIICPEGHLRAIDNWSMGFHYIAKKANVNIAFAVFDYKKKVISIEEITNVDKMSDNDMAQYIRLIYFCKFPCNAKYKDKFLLPSLEHYKD